MKRETLRGPEDYSLRNRDNKKQTYPGFSQCAATNPATYITVSNPKQGMLLDIAEANMQKVIEDMGVKGRITKARDAGNGYVLLECKRHMATNTVFAHTSQ
jgi:hypothetical protein